MIIFVVNIRPARTFWNSTHCTLSPFTLDWSRNLWHNPMWNMAVNNISYPIYPLLTRTEKGYITKMIPFFFCSVYLFQFVTIMLCVTFDNISVMYVMHGSHRLWHTFFKDFSRTFEVHFQGVFNDFSLFFQTSIREKLINNGLFN